MVLLVIALFGLIVPNGLFLFILLENLRAKSNGIGLLCSPFWVGSDLASRSIGG